MLSKKGVALITSLMVLTLVAGIVLLVSSRTFNELTHSRESAESIQTLMLARAAAVVGQTYVSESNNEFRSKLQQAAATAAASSSGRWYFGDDPSNDANAPKPDPKTVGKDFNMLFMQRNLQASMDNKFCGSTVTPAGSVGTVSLHIFIEKTACATTASPQPLPNNIKMASPRFIEGAPRSGSGALGLQTYSIPYVIVAVGRQGEFERQMTIQGELHFSAGSSSFARYAYFTNRDQSSNLWFTTNTLIDGPVHTNETFMFDGTPWFGGDVTSAGCQNVDCTGGRTYGAEFDTTQRQFLSPGTMGNTQAPVVDDTAPTFAGTNGVDWQVDYIPMPTNNQDQEAAAAGETDSGGVLQTQGIHLKATPDSENNAATVSSTRTCPGSSSGDCRLRMYATSDATATTRTPAPLTFTGLAADGTPQWDATGTHQIVEWCYAAGDCLTYRTFPNPLPGMSDQLVLERFCETGLGIGAFTPDLDCNGAITLTETRPFNGVIFSDMEVQRLTGPTRTTANDPNTAGPAIANFSQITVASDEIIRMTGDIKYEKPPRTGIAVKNADGSVTPAGDINAGAKNILGIYSLSDLRIGSQNSLADLNAPDDAMVHASLMSGQGQITVENYNSGGCRGNFQLIGGMIQTDRGPFGTFSGNTCTSGFKRTYTYDKRFLQGLSPPYFPTTVSQSGSQIYRFTFGVREQSD